MSFFDDKNPSSSQGTHNSPANAEVELNDLWRTLLGISNSALSGTAIHVPEENIQLPLPQQVAADPWSELLQSQGVELVDLQYYRPQTIQVSFSEQEVEQALQYLQEQ